MAFIRVYTGEVVEKKYPEALACSVHFALSRDGESFQALNQGYGILFARAAIREDNTIAVRGLQNPRLLRAGEEYLIYAEPLDEHWNPMEQGGYLVWKTKDFVRFGEQERVESIPESRPGANDGSGGSDEERPTELLEIPDRLLPGILERWIPLHSVSAEVSVKSLEELAQVRARVTYSDGSTDEKPVRWDRESLAALGGGRYRITGYMEPVDTGFPLAVGYADPVLFFWKGFWYFLATNDNVNDIGLFVH